MTYKQTLEWMFAQLPMYQAIGQSALIAKLDNILALSAHLGNPQLKFKSIHVAGTNGKGSTSHMLASILQEAGYDVGLYTSPHLKDFRERIRRNGAVVSEKFVVDFISDNKAFFETHKLSFFEMTVGMAFSYFAMQKVDIAIVEVGLGGRLDSTNILIPELSVITNIGMDHTDILGNTLEIIAAEKAGIIKPGVPVIISEYQEEIVGVFTAIAAKNKASIYLAEQEIPTGYVTSLPGNYQLRNVKGVVAAIRHLPGFIISEDHIVEGLKNVIKNTGLRGRWEQLQDSPKVICDTAHNREGLSLVLDQLLQQPFERLRFVLGFVKEKKLEAILPLFPKGADYYFCRPDIPRGLDALQLRERAEEYGLQGQAFPSVGEALAAALTASSPDDLIFVGGSTFTVAEVV